MRDQFSHYFTGGAQTQHKPHTVVIRSGTRELAFETDSGVFSRTELDKGTRVLLDALEGRSMSGRLLDLGCGWGAVGAALAARYPGLSVVCGDVNPRAVELTRANLARNGIDAEAYVSDGLADVPGEFDWIVMNPPIRAGKQTVYRLIEEARARLTERGALVLVWRKQQGAESAMRWLGERFASVERVSRESGYWVIVCSNR
ncbi:MAG: methyltransferase [Oscillospiraceae bacterium]|jgi:16S rRNA (guanine1207-N2)-methyltransferase|nr:methyltransferase [Oscillospiraceae bacterium]